MAELLEVENLVVRYRALGQVAALLRGVRDPFLDAVLEVSLALGTARTLGIVGESGSGKSTLGRAIMGLVRPAAGTIVFDGRHPTGRSDGALRPWRRQMALMFQDPVASLSPRLTVKSLITEPFRIHGLAGRDLDAEAGRLLRMVGLDPGFGARYPHQLSGGQARRVGVARALALSPKLIIADEPTAGLDVSVQGEVLEPHEPAAAPAGPRLYRHHPQPAGGAPRQRPARDHVHGPVRRAGCHERRCSQGRRTPTPRRC